MNMMMHTTVVMRSEARRWPRRNTNSSSRCVETSLTLVIIALIITSTCFSLAKVILCYNNNILCMYRFGGGVSANEENGTANDAHQLL